MQSANLLFFYIYIMKNMNPVSWFDISVANLERAKAFYQSVFAIELSDFPIEWGRQSAFPADFGGPNTSGALVEKSDFVAGSNNTIVYFNCEDCAVEESRVVEAGGQVLQAKTNIWEFGNIAILLDTEGNTIGLHSNK